jgi:hypothetical protein
VDRGGEIAPAAFSGRPITDSGYLKRFFTSAYSAQQSRQNLKLSFWDLHDLSSQSIGHIL